MSTKLRYMSDRPGLSLGMLFAPDRGNSSFPLPGSSFAYFSNARSAISQLLDMLHFAPGDSVLLPAYLDDVVVEPFLQRNVAVVFYKITEGLSIDIEDVTKKIGERTRAIFFINYFGFPQEFGMLKALCKKKGIFLIEDDAHGLLSTINGKPFGLFGDAAVFSIRKVIPSPEGGGLMVNNASLGNVEKKPAGPNTLFTYSAVLDLLWRDIQSRFNFSFLPVSIITERLPGFFYPRRSVALSHLSQKIIDNTDFASVARERRMNFAKILHALQGVEGIKPIYKELPDGICPWGFPVLVERREEIRKYFKKRGITLPFHWILPKDIPLNEFPVSRYLSEHCLTLPVYQGIAEWKLTTLLNMFKDAVVKK